MANAAEQRGYRKAEKRHAKEVSHRKVKDGLSDAKSRLIDILSDMEGLNRKKFEKLCTIVNKLESLQHEID